MRGRIIKHVKLLARAVKLLYTIEKRYLLVLLLSAIITPVIPFIGIYWMARIVDGLILMADLSRVYVDVGIVIVSTAIVAVLAAYLEQQKNYYQSLFVQKEEMYFSQKAMQLDYADLEDPAVKELRERIRMESRAGYNTFYLCKFLGELTSNAVSSFSAVALSFDLFARSNINRFYTLTFFVCILMVIGANCIWNQKSNSKILKMYELLTPYNTMSDFYADYLNNYETGKDIRLYQLQDTILNAQLKQTRLESEIFIKAQKNAASYKIFSTLFSYAFTIYLNIYIVMCCIRGSISVGHIAQYVTCIDLLMNSIMNIIKQVQGLINNNQYLERYFEYLDRPISGIDLPQSQVLDSNEALEVEFRNVSFKYPNTDRMILRDLSFIIRPNQKIALVGLNGSGKTTIVKLLCRFYKPTEGSITLNGIDINDYPLTQYHQILSAVYQDFVLFSLKLGQVVATSMCYDPEYVYSSLLKANSNAVLENNPSGLESYLYRDYSDDGIEISGGEAQKIALARALYKNSKMMILDEPTSALDPIAEEQVFHSFVEVAKDRTVLLVSHRLSSCQFCDEILVLQDGELVQRGSHKLLVAETAGHYYKLWTAQAKYYKDE